MNQKQELTSPHSHLTNHPLPLIFQKSEHQIPQSILPNELARHRNQKHPLEVSHVFHHVSRLTLPGLIENTCQTDF